MSDENNTPANRKPRAQMSALEAYNAAYPLAKAGKSLRQAARLLNLKVDKLGVLIYEALSMGSTPFYFRKEDEAGSSRTPNVARVKGVVVGKEKKPSLRAWIPIFALTQLGVRKGEDIVFEVIEVDGVKILQGTVSTQTSATEVSTLPE